MINHSIHFQIQRIWDENGEPRGWYRPARRGNPNSGYTIGWAGVREVRVTRASRSHSFHTCIIPTKRGRKRPPPRQHRPTQKPQFRVHIWLGLAFVYPAPPGEDAVPSSDHKSFNT